MDANKIHFSNLNGYLIQNERSKSDIINTLNNKYKLDIFNMHEKSYSDRLLDILKNKPFIACMITKGKQYILYLTKIYNENVSLLIDLKSKDNAIPKIIAVTLSIDESLFSDTVFIGEMLNNRGDWIFLIESCKIYKGQYTSNKSNLYNVQICYDFIDKYFHYNDISPFKIILKEFRGLSGIQDMLLNTKINPIGLKIIGLHNPIIFYFDTKYYNNKIINNINLYPQYDYSHIEKEKRDLLKEYISDYKVDYSLDILSNKNIDIYKSFQFILKPSKTYGIYDLLINDTSIGRARVSLIELNNEIIQIIKSQNYCYVEAFYNYKFDKWDITKIITASPQYTNVDAIHDHITELTKIQKPIYLFENC